MSFGGLVLTNKGRDLQAKAQAGATLNFTRIALGDGDLGTNIIANLNALIDEVKSCGITKLTALTAGKATVGTNFSNQDIVTGFYWKELGVFATDPDLGEILYCYGNAGATAEYIPPGGGPDIVEKVIDIVTLVGNTSSITATIDQSLAYASQQDIGDVNTLNTSAKVIVAAINELLTFAQNNVNAALLNGHDGGYYLALANQTGNISDTQHGNRGGGTLHAIATTLLAGFMSAADKAKLDGIATGATNTPLSSTNPAGLSIGGTSAVGTGTTVSRTDHKHAMPTATDLLNALKTVDGPSSGLDAASVAGKVPGTAAGNLPILDAAGRIILAQLLNILTNTVPDALTIGQTGAVGTVGAAARQDHAHAMPTATDILNALKGVDGVGCGFDADTVDGLNIQAGVVSISSIANGASKTVVVTFPRAFASAPKLICGASNEAGTFNLFPEASSITTTGFNAAAFNAGGVTGSLTFQWVALG